MWKTGKKKKIEFNKIINILEEVSKSKNHKIIVGTDSVRLGEDFVFANAICVLNNNNFYDRKYFYNRLKEKSESFSNLYDRLLKETSDSIDIACLIKENIKSVNIEIHVDVNCDSSHMSSRYKNMLVGYVTGCGFLCKVKPDSFVASGIADIHTKKM
jgi:uncharacterized protein